MGLQNNDISPDAGIAMSKLENGGFFARGNVYWVNSAAPFAADTDNTPGTKAQPFATLDYAIGRATANNGDVILVADSHAETITAAGAITADVAGLTITGLGWGSKRAAITFATNATASFVVSAPCRIQNLRLISDVDSLGVFINVVGTGNVIFDDLEFRTSSAKEAVCFVALPTTYDNFTFNRCFAYQPTDPAGSDGGATTGFVYIVDSEEIFFNDCGFFGNFETAIFHNRTTACKNLWVRNCFGIQNLAGAEPFQLVAGATGGTVGGGFITPAETAATEATLVGTLGDGFFILGGTTFGNDGAAGGQGGIVPATAS